MSLKDEFLRKTQAETGRMRFATDANGNITHLIKVIDPELRGVYESLMDVRCANLATILAVTEDNGKVLVHQEYIRGENLKNWSGNSTDDVLLDIAIDITRALCAVHSLQPPIIHRDVKPANIIRRHDGSCVLVDFDAGRTLKADADGDTQVVATIGFAAPEQFGLMQSDARSDIFSLGATLYWLKTGKPLRSTGRCSGRLGRIVKKCTNIDPQKRYPSAQALLHDLQRLTQRKTHIWKMLISAALSALVLFVGTYVGYHHALNLPNAYTGCTCKFVVTDTLPFDQQVHQFHPGDKPVQVQMHVEGYMDNTGCTAAKHRPAQLATIKNVRPGIQSLGGSAEIERNGCLTFSAQGLYTVDADVFYGSELVNCVTETIVLTDDPLPYYHCTCEPISRESFTHVGVDPTLPTDGSMLKVPMSAVAAIDSSNCTAAEHVETWQCGTVILQSPSQANCGISEGNLFYTDTPGNYETRTHFALGLYSCYSHHLLTVTPPKQD